MEEKYLHYAIIAIVLYVIWKNFLTPRVANRLPGGGVQTGPAPGTGGAPNPFTLSPPPTQQGQTVTGSASGDQLLGAGIAAFGNLGAALINKDWGTPGVDGSGGGGGFDSGSGGWTDVTDDDWADA